MGAPATTDSDDVAAEDHGTGGTAPDVDVAELDELIAALDTVRAAAARSKEFGFDQPWPVFIRLMRLLTPQSYGARIQNRLARSFNWTVVPASLDRGDVVDASGRYFEVKVTLITESNPGANFVQIRPHQDIAGYHCFVVQQDYTVVHLRLTKAQMARELAALGSSAHGTTTAVARNGTRELAIRLAWTPTSGDAARWIRRYGQGTITPA